MFFFFNDTATTEIYTLSLHDALPIYRSMRATRHPVRACMLSTESISLWLLRSLASGDRKSTRLNSSHSQISYAVFCLKKKNIAYPRDDDAVRAAQLRGRGASVNRYAP